MTHLRHGFRLRRGFGGQDGGHGFERIVMAFCDRFIAQRTFELIVEPALADLEFEDAAGRHSRIATRAAVLRAMLGGLRHDIQRGSGDFLKLSLLSISYFMFPVAVSGSLFTTWFDYLIAATFVLVMAMVPVMVCFWPTRYPVHPGD
jgi:hypothetical protein